jgi:hypothetical protein
MVRLLAASILALAVCATVCLADEVKGTVKKVAKGKITVTVDGKDTSYPVQKDARILNSTVSKTKAGKDREKVTEISGGLMAVKTGATVSLKLEKEIVGVDEKDVVTQLKVMPAEAKK